MKIINKPKKSLGQNFLIDQNITKKIIKIGNIDTDKKIIEIGAGYGSLTNNILMKNPKKIYAIEKDKKISFFLKEKFKDFSNINIINEDIFKIIEKNNFGNNIIVFGNLPYNISTKILISLIMIKKWPPWYDHLILMFQKEVADRIIAKEKTKQFGRLSIIANWRLEIKKHFDISKNCFFPKPKVNSTLISLKPKKKFHELKSPKNLEMVTRILFSNRRKMINKNLKKLFKKDLSVAKLLNINLNSRPEELSSDTYYKITKEFENLFC